MDFEDLTKDQKILVAMRKTLANIIKDTTPGKGMIHPLTESTVEDIKLCLGLISSRERELNEEQGKASFKPHFVDEKKQDEPAVQEAQVIKFHPSSSKS